MSVLEKSQQSITQEASEIVISGGKGFSFFKRFFDIVCAVCGLILTAIPMLIIAILIRIDTPGPAIYKQERLGLNRKPFVLYKFRSMHINAEENGPQWAIKGDDRVTKVGSFLRESRLDELPQLINILFGEMSLVGPRPEREYFYNVFEAYIPDFGKRMLVKPGLTGWAQVNGGYDLSAEEKIIYDLEYIRGRSVKMELLCIFRTIKLVFTHEGAR